MAGCSGGAGGSAPPPEAHLIGVTVSPGTAAIPKGASQQFTATGQFSDGTTEDLTSRVAWTSSIPAIASISSGGLATSLATGNVTIQATSQNFTGSASLTVNPAALVSLVVTPGSASISKGLQQQFTATGTYTDASTQIITSTVSWSSSNTGIATVAAGLASTLAIGNVTITAASGAISGTATLTVNPAVLVSIAVTPGAATIAKGLSQQFIATGTYSDSSTQNLTSTVTWTSSNTGVATVSGGLATALAVGSASITASSGSIAGSATLTVNPAGLVSIAVTPGNVIIPKGLTQQFTATGTYTDHSTQDLTSTALWTSSNPGVASVSAGLATGLAQGTATISASSGSISGSASLTVNPAALVSIVVSPTSPSIAKGLSQEFTATGTYTDGSAVDITSSVIWNSSNPGIASVTSAGILTANQVGTTLLSATQGTIVGSTIVQVTPAAVTTIVIAPGTAAIAKGLTQQFTATATFTDGTVQDVSTTANWGSSNTSIASITNAGLATALAVGITTISATSGSVTGFATLTVNPAALVSLAVTPAMATISKGLAQQFTATGTYTDSSTQDLTATAAWSSSNTGVATVVAGLATGAGEGSATITANSTGIMGSASLTVNPAALVSITVSPSNPQISVGQQQQFTATGTYTDNTVQTITNSCTWASLNTGVATINSVGLASGVGAGTATITATSAGIAGMATLTVNAATLISIAVTPPTATIPKGLTQQFTATGTFSDNSMQDLTASAVWTSSNNSVATVVAGLATGAGEGSATISATSAGITGNAALTVTAPNLVSIAVMPANPAIPLGSTQQFTATGTYTDGSMQDVTSASTWSSSDTGIAMISNTSGSIGLATAEGIGVSTIQATDGLIVGSTTLTVGPGGNVTITLSPRNVGLTLTQAQQYTATILNTTNTGATWSVDGVSGGNSTVGIISSSGLYTPPSVAGVHTVTGTSVADPSKSASASVAVTDYAGQTLYHNDLGATGQNLSELALTTSNVNQNTFGKLFSCPVDGNVYTQPLYVANLPIAGGIHNVIFIATENDSVYAFDADNSACQVLWQTSFLSTGVTPIPYTDLGGGNCTEIVPQLGITGTPVIDLVSNTIYLVAATLEGPSSMQSSYVHRLHALNLLTGQELPSSPVVITGSVPGTGTGSSGGILTMNSQMQKSRTAVSLVNGVLYFGFSSDCDADPFHGWIYAYDQTSLSQIAVYCSTANASGGGVWHGSGTLTFDSLGNLYAITGNGDFDVNTGGTDYGDSVLKMNLSGSTLAVEDYFTPFNQAILDGQNLDLGSFSLMLLPDQPGPNPHLAVGAGKFGTLFLLDRDNLGQYNSTSDQIVQELTSAVTKSFSTATYWNSNLYFSTAADYARQFTISNGLLSTTAISKSPAKFPFPGATGSISAASPAALSAILWILDNSGFGVQGGAPTPAILHAYNASNLANELYNSTQAAGGRDTADLAIKFMIPTVANGKVYFGTQTALDVYGLLP